MAICSCTMVRIGRVHSIQRWRNHQINRSSRSRVSVCRHLLPKEIAKIIFIEGTDDDYADIMICVIWQFCIYLPLAFIWNRWRKNDFACESCWKRIERERETTPTSTETMWIWWNVTHIIFQKDVHLFKTNRRRIGEFNSVYLYCKASWYGPYTYTY